MPLAEDEWIACTYQTVPWRQQIRAGSKADRMVRSIQVCIPALIASRTFSLRADLVSKGEAAIGAISTLDHSYGETLKSLDRLLIRAESIASSKIESLHATPEEYARALYGDNSNSSAVAMVAGTKALTQMIDAVESGKAITEKLIKQAHKTLMQDVQREQESAGKYREVQNWIQGSNHSPLGAFFVPPPPEYVAKLMQDLLHFVNRDDLPVLAQAAIAHAQFETIHPFTDGNGRIGRALVNVILRRRNITSRVVVPIASFLVSDRGAYFDVLDKYRDGKIEDLLRRFIIAANIAATQSTRTASTLTELPAVWRKKLGRVRTGGSTALLLSSLISKPVFSAEELIGDKGANSTSIYNAIARLQEVGIIAPLSERKRNQIWGAVDVLQELEGLDLSIAMARQ